MAKKLKNTKTNPKRNPFGRAKDVYLTKNKIAVTTVQTCSSQRGYTKTEKTKYYEQNPSNLKLLKSAKRNTVRIGRTGNNYKSL